MTPRRALISLAFAGAALAATPVLARTFHHWFPGFAAAALPPGETLPEIADLPVVAVAPRAGPPRAAVILVTGSGGWADLDRKLAAGFAAEGIATLGLDSLRYFLAPRSPDEAGADVGRMIECARRVWGVEDVALVGYSFGADTVPVAYNRLPPADRAAVRAVAMLGLSRTADLAMGVAKIVARLDGYPQSTAAEVARVAQAPERPAIVCVYGEREQAEGRTLCPLLDPSRVRLIETAGGHHFDGDYAALAHAVAATLKRA